MGFFMRAVIQRVDRACVKINSQLFSAIDQGILIFLGIERNDSEKDAEHILEKALNLRIFEDENRKMNLSLIDIEGQMLVVSQFTLLGDCIKGRRPSFGRAEEPARAKQLYEYFMQQAAPKVKKLAAGKFQEMMQVELTNNGPVTLWLDSRKTL